MIAAKAAAGAHKFRLFVAGDTPNSIEALGNLRALCREHFADSCHIEIVDVFREPKRALAEGIFMTPALKRIAPLPARTVIGTLSQASAVLKALGLDSRAS